MFSFNFTVICENTVLFMIGMLLCLFLTICVSLTCERFTQRVYILLIKYGVLLDDEPNIHPTVTNRSSVHI